MSKKRKIFVLDTCVILYDHTAYRKFGDNDVILPIAVLEELDHFKKGNEAINYEAREFIRIIDKLSVTNGLDEWTEIGEKDTGRIKVSFQKNIPQTDATEIFHDKKADHRILNVAMLAHEKDPDQEVILVTKDVNLRVKAKSLGLQTEDYRTDIRENVHHKHTGKYLITGVDSEKIDKFYEENEIDLEEFKGCKGYPKKRDVINNTYFIIKNGKKSALGYYCAFSKKLKLVGKQRIKGVTPRNSEQIFAAHAIMNSDVRIVSVQGRAGTGKTLIALAAAFEEMRNYNQILIARPIVPLNNRDLGYLPGDVSDKVGPYMDPIWDNVKFIKTQCGSTLPEDDISVVPLAYIRGRSLSDVIFIIDEAQNLSPIEIKTIITRIGENSKIIFTGDIAQIDSPYLDQNSNGLSYMIDRLKGESIYSHITLEKGERSDVATLAADKL